MARARPGRSSVKALAGSLGRGLAEIGIEKLLDAKVGGAKSAAEKQIFLVVVAQQRDERVPGTRDPWWRCWSVDQARPVSD